MPGTKKIKKTPNKNRRSTDKEHIPNTRDNYYLGLSSEGFHRLYYREWGDPKSEHTIVCVHGVTRISHDFDVLAKELSKHYRVICPDIVGRGNSDWFGNKESYNFIQYSADLNALFAHLHVERLHFLGTSMGGLLGMIMAAMAHTPIQSLILNDVGPEIKRTELRKIGDYIGKNMVFSTQKEYFDYYSKIYQGLGSLISASEFKKLAKYSAFKAQDGYRLHYDPKIGDAFRKNYSFFNFDLWKYWEEVECPVLVIRGSESSFLTEETAEQMIETGANAELVVIEKAGHTPPLRTKYEIDQVLKFFHQAIKEEKEPNTQSVRH